MNEIQFIFMILGLITIPVGVWLLFSLGWALIVLGVISFILLLSSEEVKK